MKNILMLLCAAGFLTGCKPAQPAAKPASAPPPPSSQQTQAPTQPQAAAPAERQGIVHDISQAVDYGIGATQLKAKKSAVDRIKKINAQQQRQHQDALDQ